MHILEVEAFSFQYPEASAPALKQVDMSVEEGSFVVLCGKSGCGKSTLLRQCKSVLAPHGQRSGAIRYCGVPLDEVSHRTQSAEIGYVLQNPDNQIVTDKVWHELAFGLESLGCDTPTIRLRVAEMASYFGIQDWFMRNVSELSGGQKQLLNLASVMAMHPRLLILDEPTSQLDPIAASDFLETVRKINRDIGTTILLTEHRLEDVIPWADSLLVMDSGRMIATGTPSEIGQRLHDMGHDMFLSMPTPMQIYAGVTAREQKAHALPCPLTVSEGRRWMQELLGAEAVRTEPQPSDAAGAKERNGKPQNPSAGRTSPEETLAACGEREKGASAAAEMPEPAGKRNPKDARGGDIPAIRVRDVWFRYDRDLPDVVRGLSMDVRRGEIFAIVGGNGTGKSTTMNLIAHIRFPYRGRIWLNGRDINKYSDDELYHGFLGVMPQNPQSLFVKKTVREDLYEMIDGKRQKKTSAYPIDMPKKEAVEGIVSLTMLEDLLDRHPYDLSGGEQQRLALAKVLLLRPQILLMDEPTKGIDNYFKRDLGQILRRLTAHGVTVLMISHDVEFCAQYADRVGLFFQGNLVTSNTTRAFFAGNSFYTTAANRMARHFYPDAVTAEDVITAMNRTLAQNRES
ncbi:ABC transporter ATP-binding protein [Bilifractor sp. LCP19S3_H10]|uniref:ABC transporter ATP-binding protein n=1 Tax=Bilifractor sp. LCP19S3_H10 TaxID=3438736 RepID=UPI003F9258FD